MSFKLCLEGEPNFNKERRRGRVERVVVSALSKADGRALLRTECVSLSQIQIET